MEICDGESWAAAGGDVSDGGTVNDFALHCGDTCTSDAGATVLFAQHCQGCAKGGPGKPKIHRKSMKHRPWATPGVSRWRQGCVPHQK